MLSNGEIVIQESLLSCQCPELICHRRFPIAGEGLCIQAPIQNIRSNHFKAAAQAQHTRVPLGDSICDPHVRW